MLARDVSPVAGGFDGVDGVEVVRALHDDTASLLVGERRIAVVVAKVADGG